MYISSMWDSSMIIRGFTTCSMVIGMVLEGWCGFYAFVTWSYGEATLSSNNGSHQWVHHLHLAKDSLWEITTRIKTVMHHNQRVSHAKRGLICRKWVICGGLVHLGWWISFWYFMLDSTRVIMYKTQYQVREECCWCDGIVIGKMRDDKGTCRETWRLRVPIMGDECQ